MASVIMLFVTTEIGNRFDNNLLIYFAINIEEKFMELLKPLHFLRRRFCSSEFILLKLM